MFHNLLPGPELQRNHLDITNLPGFIAYMFDDMMYRVPIGDWLGMIGMAP